MFQSVFKEWLGPASWSRCWMTTTVPCTPLPKSPYWENISVIFYMTTMEACWLLTKTGVERSVDDFVSLLALSCNQCYYASSQVGDLRGHLKSHSGEKSNKCNECDFASFRADHLRAHLKTHSKDKSKQMQQVWLCLLRPKFFKKVTIFHHEQNLSWLA